MGKLSVFISHSTDHTNVADMERMRAIVAELEAGDGGLDVMWDGGEIKSADDWRARIHIMLAECRAAIILFSERALTQSQWVLKEATILCHRRARDNGFRVLPIIMPDATESRLTEGAWAPLAFNTIQYQRESAADIADLVKKARAGLESVASKRTLLDDLAEAIAAHLENAPVTGLKAASELHLARKDWEGAPTVQLGFSKGLARMLLQTRTLTEAVTLLDSIHGITPDEAQEVFNLIAPLWVDGDAAAPLYSGVLHGRPHFDVGLNGLRLGLYTANSYVRRAHPETSLPVLHVVPDSNAGDMVEHIAESLRGDVRKAFPDLSELPDDIIDESLNDVNVRRFVYVPALLNDTELTGLRAVYSHPTFIFGTGATLPTTPPPAGVHYLRPELDTEREKAALKEWMVARTNIANRRKRVGGG